MRKFFAMIAIAGTIVACNNSGEGSDSLKDSLYQDSLRRDSMMKAEQNNMNNMPSMPDTGMNNMNKMDTGMNKMSGDTTPMK